MSEVCKNCGHGIKNVNGTFYHSGETFSGIKYLQKLCWYGEIRNNISSCDCENPEPTIEETKKRIP